MDENRYLYFLKNHEYKELLQQAEHARLVKRMERYEKARDRFRRVTGFAAPLSRLAGMLISAGTRLQTWLGEKPNPCPGEGPAAYSYSD